VFGKAQIFTKQSTTYNNDLHALAFSKEVDIIEENIKDHDDDKICELKKDYKDDI